MGTRQDPASLMSRGPPAACMAGLAPVTSEESAPRGHPPPPGRFCSWAHPGRLRRVLWPLPRSPHPGLQVGSLVGGAKGCVPPGVRLSPPGARGWLGCPLLLHTGALSISTRTRTRQRLSLEARVAPSAGSCLPALPPGLAGGGTCRRSQGLFSAAGLPGTPVCPKVWPQGGPAGPKAAPGAEAWGEGQTLPVPRRPLPTPAQVGGGPSPFSPQPRAPSLCRPAWGPQSGQMEFPGPLPQPPCS